MMGKNRIMIYGPKDDGTYVVEFKTVEATCWAVVGPHFQERMPYGLFVPDVRSSP